jgi:hypothetical protein
MELACMYLCDCGHMESLMIDYTHLYLRMRSDSGVCLKLLSLN